MGRAFWWIISATLLVMAIAAGLPLYEGWVFDGEAPARMFKFDAYGTWLQGSLTPIAILAALVGVGIQTAAQRASNRLAALGLISANTKALADHLNYKAAAAINGRRISSRDVDMHTPMYFIQQIINDPTQVRDGGLRSELVRDLNIILDMSEREEASFLLDYRLIELRSALGRR